MVLLTPVGEPSAGGPIQRGNGMVQRWDGAGQEDVARSLDKHVVTAVRAIATTISIKIGIVIHLIGGQPATGILLNRVHLD